MYKGTIILQMDLSRKKVNVAELGHVAFSGCLVEMCAVDGSSDAKTA